MVPDAGVLVDELEIMARLGITVIEVAGLPDPVAYVARESVCLIRHGLDPERRQAAGSAALASALRHWSRQPRP